MYHIEADQERPITTKAESMSSPERLNPLTNIFDFLQGCKQPPEFRMVKIHLTLCQCLIKVLKVLKHTKQFCEDIRATHAGRSLALASQRCHTMMDRFQNHSLYSLEQFGRRVNPSALLNHG